MILTNEKIEVTYEMLYKAGMTRGNQYGIPYRHSLIWKEFENLDEQDFDVLELYFSGVKSADLPERIKKIPVFDKLLTDINIEKYLLSYNQIALTNSDFEDLLGKGGICDTSFGGKIKVIDLYEEIMKFNELRFHSIFNIDKGNFSIQIFFIKGHTISHKTIEKFKRLTKTAENLYISKSLLFANWDKQEVNSLIVEK